MKEKHIKPCILNDILKEWYDVYQNYVGNDKLLKEAREELIRYQTKSREADIYRKAKREIENDNI